jgi:ATP phosphoribosyltransferase regulatory subunit
MKNKLLHTPEGVRDIYNSECERKLYLQDTLFDGLKKYGYQPIQTPSFEYFDVFGNEIGTTPSKELYKFFDREGNTLVLRPDITPSIARAAAKYYMDEEIPMRFCYVGNTFTNNSSYQGRLKETTQIGAELLGDDSAEADAEMIAMVVDSFLTAGLKEFEISIGHSAIFTSLCKAASIEEDDAEELRSLIFNKNYFGMEKLLGKISNADGIADDIRQVFLELPKCYGSIEVLEHAGKFSDAVPEAAAAIKRLKDVYELLTLYGYEKYVSFDLSTLSPYEYYTGILFSGYTFGSGEAVAKGGRYDELLGHFGKQSAAVGFVIMLDQLMSALQRQHIEIPYKEKKCLILYSANRRAKAIAKAGAMREDGTQTMLIEKSASIPEESYEAYCRRNQITDIIYMDGE